MSENAPTPAHKRGWFRFSLKGLFVVVTLLALALGWIGWNLNRARYRESLLSDLRMKGARITQVPARSSPFLLRTFGTTHVAIILLPSATFSEDDIERYRKTFPETKIELFGGSFDGLQL
jgi:hypothetical protein